MRSFGPCPGDKVSPPGRLCLITDFRFIDEERLEKIMEEAIKGGVDTILYRDDSPSLPLRYGRARRIFSVTEAMKIPLLIHSDVDLALKLKAGGVHLGQRGPSPAEARQKLGPCFYIGVSVHNEEEIERAEKGGADYLILSPFFKPGSKEIAKPPLGERGFEKLRKKTALPLLALGGIDKEKADLPIARGADGVAVITGLLREKDIHEAAFCMKKSIVGTLNKNRAR